jgi:PAS domain S-box-containing protein
MRKVLDRMKTKSSELGPSARPAAGRVESSVIGALPGIVLNSLTSGVLAVDSDGRAVFVNAALSRDLGIDREKWEGQPATELFRPVTSQVPPKRLPLYCLDSLRQSHRTQSREVELRDGGRITHLREDSGPLRDERGNVVGRLYAYHDLSWEKTLDQMKSEFISIASHELRTPMTSIKGAVDLILSGSNGSVSEEAHDLLEVAQSGCERMIRLINDILDLSKIEAGQTQLRLARIDLSEVVDHSLVSLKPLATKDEITFEVQRPERLSWVEADRDRMEQVITNLVANAIKFSPVKGTIRLQLSEEAGWVHCSVADEGCGIKDEDLDRIFGKFQQVGSPQRGGGTGLGLAITQALITEHRGKIWVQSSVGQGSQFIFRLPAVAAQPAELA